MKAIIGLKAQSFKVDNYIIFWKKKNRK